MGQLGNVLLAIDKAHKHLERALHYRPGLDRLRLKKFYLFRIPQFLEIVLQCYTCGTSKLSYL